MADYQTGFFILADGGPHATDLENLDPYGKPFTYAIISPPKKGKASIAKADISRLNPATGQIETTKDSSILVFDPGKDFEALPKDEIEAVSLWLKITDSAEKALVEKYNLSVKGVPKPLATLRAEQEKKIDLGDWASNLNYEEAIFAIVTPPEKGTATLDGSTLNFDPGEDFEDLEPQETKKAEIVLSVTDARGTTLETVTVTIKGTLTKFIPNIASPTLYPRETVKEGGGYSAYFSLLPKKSSERIMVAWKAYQAPVMTPRYNGITDVTAIEPGINFGEATFDVSGIEGLRTSVFFWIIGAQTDPSDPQYREKVKFIENKAVAWINPHPEATPPDAVVFAPTADPEILQQNRPDPVTFTVGASNAGEEPVIATYKIEQKPNPNYVTSGSLTFPPGDSTQTVKFYPLGSAQDKRRRLVVFTVTGANSGKVPYWPIPLNVPIEPLLPEGESAVDW